MYWINFVFLFGVGIALDAIDELLTRLDLAAQRWIEDRSLWFFRRLKKNSFWLAKVLLWSWFVAMVGTLWWLWHGKITRGPDIYFMAEALYAVGVGIVAYLWHKSLEYDEKRAFKADLVDRSNPKKPKKFFRLALAGCVLAILVSCAFLRRAYALADFLLSVAAPLPLLIFIVYLSACNYLDPEKVEEYITHV